MPHPPSADPAPPGSTSSSIEEDSLDITRADHFTLWITQMRPRLIAMTRKSGVPEDVVQGVIFSAWKNRTRYDRARSKLSAWLYTICRSACSNWWRAHGRREARTDSLDADQQEDAVSNSAATGMDRMAIEQHSHTVALTEKLALFKDFFAQYCAEQGAAAATPKQKEILQRVMAIITLFPQYDSQLELAKELGITWAQLHHSMQKLRLAFQAYLSINAPDLLPSHE